MTFEVEVNGAIHPFDNEVEAFYFIRSLKGKWGGNDEVRAIADGRIQARWLIRDFVS